MKKFLLFVVVLVFIAGCSILSETVNADSLKVLTLSSSKSNAVNKVWVGTFQLVFNDMKNQILKLKHIEFVGERPTSDLVGLNKEEFKSSMLNPETYYKSYGKTSPVAREQIKKDIKEKFNETSDLIERLDWREAPGRYYAYAMLKKEFEFLKEFDKLEPQSFNNSDKKYGYFGIKKPSDGSMNKNIRVLFYNSQDDFAIQLETKNDDVVYLYRTESNDSFDKIYEKMKKERDSYTGDYNFGNIDTFKAPNLKFKTIKKYDELCNKIIKGTNSYFSAAIETIQFELNNKGGKLKSEAIIMLQKASIASEPKTPRHFDFDKTFVLFLVDKGKQNPYFALRVKDLKDLVE